MLNRQILYDKNNEPKVSFTNVEGETACLNNMFAFIQKNKKLRGNLDNLSMNDKLVSKVQAAIDKADWRNEVFKNPDCATAILYLIQQNNLSFIAGLNVYFNVLAIQGLKQFKNTNLRFRHILKRNRLSTLGRNFVGNLKYSAEEYKLNINSVDKFEEFVNTLSKQEQYFIQLEYDLPVDKSLHPEISSEHLIEALAANMLYVLRKVDKINDKVCVIIPSVAVTTFLHEKLFNNPVLMMPCFGAIGSQTLEDMHQLNIHPVSFPHPDVLSSLKSVHGYPENPFLVVWHDIAHSQWGSLIPLESRKILFDRIVPVFKSLTKRHAETSIPPEILRIPYDKLIDFDLTSILFYKNPLNRACIYLARAINVLPPSVLGQDLSDLAEKITKDSARKKDITVEDSFRFTFSLASFVASAAIEKRQGPSFFDRSKSAADIASNSPIKPNANK